MFVQILHHTCQRFIPERKPEFTNCQSKLLGGETPHSDILYTLSFSCFCVFCALSSAAVVHLLPVSTFCAFRDALLQTSVVTI